MSDGKNLSEAEKEIMEIFWSSGKPMLASDVFNILEETKWKYTTVATFLSRLVKKGFLKCEKQGMHNCFSVKISHNRFLKEETKKFVDDIYDGSAKNLIACLCKERISENDYKELMEFIEKIDEKKGGE